MKAYQIMEEIINEVSVNKWKEAAKNSIEGRKAKAEEASDRFGSVVYPFRPEVNDPGHKLANAWDKAEQRADRAEQLAKNLPNSNRSANELKNAAKKVIDKRDKDNEEAVNKLQNAVDKFKEKSYDERTDKDYSDLAKVQNEWVNKQKKENRARNLVGKPERRPEKNSEGKHELKEQGYIDRTNEALDIMEEILLEASPLEVKRRIANEFKDKIGDMYNKAVEDDKKNSEEKMNLHNKIHGEGGNTVVVMRDKVENFSDNPEIRKDQEKFNEVTDKSKKSGEKVHKLGNLKNLVDYYKNEALEVNEDKEAALSQLRNEYDKEAENIPNGSKEMYELNKKYGKFKKKVDKHFSKNEALELAEAIINEFTEADKKEAAKKVLKDRMLDFYDKYYELEDAVPTKGDMEDFKRKEKRYKHAEKVANEALSLAESIIGYADNIFELDYENKQNVNTNKIRKLKKDKDGENVEVVSVADELFPYEGNAKQQFNQKVLAKINDMIEGKGSLEDLIQFVRKYSGNRKGGNEKLHEAVELMEDLYSQIKKVYGEPEYKYNKDSGLEPANKSAELIYKADDVRMKEYSQEKEKNPNIDLYKKRLTTKNTRGKNKTEYRSSKYRKFSDDWRLPKTDDERIEGSIRRHNEKVNKSLKEALEEIKQVVEGLFVKDGRGDLLNDIDNALGSPVKKTAKDMVKQCTGCKQKKVNEAIELMEEIINEVSVSRWKEAAANSIEGRKAKKDSNEDDYYAFSGKISRDMQKQLDKEHAERDNYHSDRVSRAEYLAKNLPDSKKSASKVLRAAKDAVKTRSNKVDKIASDIDKKNKKEVPLMKAIIGKDGKEFDKYATKHNERAKNFSVTSDREKHARIMANEPVRTYDDDKIKPEKGLYAQNSTSYKEDHKNRVSNLENAERVASKAYNKYIDNPTLDNEEKAKEANAKFKHAEKQYKNSKLSHKV